MSCEKSNSDQSLHTGGGGGVDESRVNEVRGQSNLVETAWRPKACD